MSSVHPTRPLPQTGDDALIICGGRRAPALIEDVAGTSVTVTSDGEQLIFDLHPLTAQFVRRGDPSYGMRLLLTGPTGP